MPRRFIQIVKIRFGIAKVFLQAAATFASHNLEIDRMVD